MQQCSMFCSIKYYKTVRQLWEKSSHPKILQIHTKNISSTVCSTYISAHTHTQTHTHHQCFAFMTTQTVNELRVHNYAATCFPDGTFPVFPSCMSKASLPASCLQLSSFTHLCCFIILILVFLRENTTECFIKYTAREKRKSNTDVPRNVLF